VVAELTQSMAEIKSFHKNLDLSWVAAEDAHVEAEHAQKKTKYA
jgi:hypothetical protein